MSLGGHLLEMKAAGRKIVATTAYDFWSASLLEGTPVDFLLVGDSVAMVVYGYPSTRVASVEMMRTHVEAVRRGAPQQRIVADVPWPAMQGGVDAALAAGRALKEAGADAVKVEALPGHLEVVTRLLAEGVPVMGHVGLLPQTVTAPDAFRVRGRGPDAAAVTDAAHQMEEAGCLAVVVECVPAELGARITDELRIPTVGIGAGSATDGQILVLQDLMGWTPGPTPRFVRRFAQEGTSVTSAVEAYAAAVRDGSFPTGEESYS